MTFFLLLLFISLIIILIVHSNFSYYPLRASATVAQPNSSGPAIHDPGLQAVVIYRGLDFPTNMAFLAPNDILVLEQKNGKVQRIVNGKILQDPVLDVNVANENERGMLGIAITRNETTSKTYVFLYYTETEIEGSDDCQKPNPCVPGHDPLGNRLYRYEWDSNSSKLINPKLLLDLPAVPGPSHNGGKIVIGPDDHVYMTIGDLVGYRSQTQNFNDGPANSNGTSGILRVTQEGKVISYGMDFDPLTNMFWDTGIIGDTYPLNLYYAYGIRNSYGMDFDPLTNMLWITDNGPAFGDEINLVEAGFNGGWRKIQGIWELKGSTYGNVTLDPEGLDLVDFQGRGKYRTPEFTWLNSTAPTALVFLDSDKLGKQYQNDIFVGNFKGRNIYHFDLNENRTHLALEGPLADRVADTAEESQGILFGEGFGRITDMQIGPDGYLYVLTLSGSGRIYKIIPIGSENS
jgi:aldose sugar dehydrogenase